MVRLKEAAHPVGIEPAHLVKSSPKFGGLVNVNLACLLSISLAEFLAGSKALETPLKDATLAGEVGGAVKSQIAREQDLVRVQKMCMGITAQVNRLALPINLERIGAGGKRIAWRAVVLN